MHFEISENKVTPEDIIEFRKTTSWNVPTKEQSEIAIKNTLYSIKVSLDGKTIGISRLVGDCAIIWYIQDVIVLPEYQGQGVGKLMISNLLEYIKKNSVAGTNVSISLMSARGKEDFYKKFGFYSRPSDTDGPGMNLKIKVD